MRRTIKAVFGCILSMAIGIIASRVSAAEIVVIHRVVNLPGVSHQAVRAFTDGAGIGFFEGPSIGITNQHINVPAKVLSLVANPLILDAQFPTPPTGTQYIFYQWIIDGEISWTPEQTIMVTGDETTLATALYWRTSVENGTCAPDCNLAIYAINLTTEVTIRPPGLAMTFRGFSTSPGGQGTRGIVC